MLPLGSNPPALRRAYRTGDRRAAVGSLLLPARDNILTAMPEIAPSARARTSVPEVSPRPRALSWPSARRLRLPSMMLGLAVVYYVAAKVGYALEFAGPVAAVIWLPAGVGIAFLALGGLRLWPGVVLGR